MGSTLSFYHFRYMLSACSTSNKNINDYYVNRQGDFKVCVLKLQTLPGMMALAFNLSIWAQRQEDLCYLEGSLLYIGGQSPIKRTSFKTNKHI